LDKLKQQIAKNKKEQEQAKQLEVINEAPKKIIDTANVPVTQVAFEQVWNSYLQQLEIDKKMSLGVILKNAKWQILNQEQVEIILASQHEREMFEEERINTIPFFRKNLSNTSFDLLIKINNTFQSNKVFTTEEKFKAMAEKNPLLNEFRKIMALDLE
jgi:DNA polymerase III subunit gamma/tau